MTIRITKPEINLREKISELDKPSGVAGEAMLRAETPQEQQAMIGVGRRNMLINGDMKVSQRGNYTGATTAALDAYFLDRWKCDRNGTATMEHTTSHDIPGSPAICKAIKLVQTVTGNNYLGIRQRIEDPTQYVGRTFTYSGWVRSNTSNARLECFVHGTNQTAIGPNHSGNGEWEFLSFTWTMSGIPSTNWYADVFIDSGAYGNVTITAGDYFEATMLQLEEGKVATPFEHRSYGEELALCQRYCQVYDTLGSGVWNSATSFFSSTSLPVSMRVVPTITLKSGTYTNINIEHVDTYDITGVSPGHASNAGDNETWEVSTFITVMSVTNARTVGDAGVPVCDRNEDYFILTAEL